jgi:hypothetical protein
MASDDTQSSNNDDDSKHQSTQSPSVADEQSLSGSTPDPESDDDTLEAAHEAGLYEDADDEHPAELNLAEEVEKDEKRHQQED